MPTTKMSHCHILPPLATVEDAMDDVVLTFYYGPALYFQFEGWQYKLQYELLQLLL